MSDKTIASAPAANRSLRAPAKSYSLEQALVLDRLYVCLTSLANVYDPDPDYMGIEDEQALNELIDEAIEQLPAEDRSFWRREVAQVVARLKRRDYDAVKASLLETAAAISSSIAQMTPPPEMLARIRQRDSESE